MLNRSASVEWGQAVATAQPTLPSDDGPNKRRTGMSRLIAHVDDDQDIRLQVRAILEKEGYSVRSYETVEKLLDEMDAAKPDLVILDVIVSEADSGITGYGRLAERHPNLPVVLLTSLGDAVRPFLADRPEHVWILEKPVFPEVLRDTVRRRIGKPGG
jgi:DNA-binding NtrC family response regulator